MSCLTEIEILVNCKECKEKSNLIDDDIDIICDDCFESNDNEKLKTFIDNFIDEIEEDKLMEIDGEFIVGFNDEKERKNFLEGAKYGMQQVIITLEIMSHDYGFNFSEKVKSLQKRWFDQKVNSKLNDHDKYRCESCNGDGYLKSIQE